MSNVVDERIVEMQFNNQQFENGIKTSLGSIEKLKKGLNFDEASRSLSGLSAATSRFSLAGIANSVENIASRFSNMGIVGVTALVNIANAAVNAGKKIVASLTIDPVSKGFQEYEAGLSAFQTIFANTQSTTAKVDQKQISEINKRAAAETEALQKKMTESSSSGTSKRLAAQVRALAKTAKEELKVLNDTQEAASEALNKALSEETKAINSAHQAKLAVYDEEYMAKLKVIDEDRYNKIKAIDDEINSIKGLTSAEEEALRIEEEKKNLQELQLDVMNAKTAKNRIAAEKALYDYQKKLGREQLLRDRDSRITELETSKTVIEDEYNLKISKITEEYTTKLNQEDELFSIISKNLNDQQIEKLKSLALIHQTEKENLQERQSLESQALSARSSSSSKSQAEALQAIEERRKAEVKALEDAAAAIKMPSSKDDINKTLAEMNDYANKTIYSFGDMTKAMGLFTAQGVNLGDSSAAIKGIFNIVSLTGGTADKAQSAIYQLSQAVAGGTVRAMDWNSVINAGIGGIDFQNQLKQTARVHGVAVDDMIAKQGNFKNSLEEGWLSSSILLETLQQYTGDISDEQLKALGYTDEQIKQIQKLGETANKSATQLKSYTQLMDTLMSNVATGWSQSFKLIFGDLDEATVLWTDIGNAVGGALGAISDSRNEMLKVWKDAGGREVLIKSFTNVFQFLGKVITPITEAFREFFPPATAKTLAHLTMSFARFSESLKMGDETAGKIKETFRGVFSVFSLGKQFIVSVAKAFGKLIKYLAPVGENLLTMTASIGSWLVSLDSAAKSSDIFSEAIDKIGSVLSTIGVFIKTTIQSIADSFSSLGTTNLSGTQSFSDNITAILSPLAGFLEKIKSVWEKIKEVASGIASVVGGALSKAFSDLRNLFSNSTGDLDLDRILAVFSAGLFTALVAGFIDFLRQFKVFMGTGRDMLKEVVGILDGIKGSLQAYQDQLKAGTLLKIAVAIGILAAALLVLSLLDPVKLGIATAAITALFIELMGSMAVMSKVTGKKTLEGSTSLSIALIGMAAAILILAFAMTELSKLNIEQLGLATAGLLAVIMALISVSTLMQKNSRGFIKSALSVVVFALGISSLASGLEKLAAVVATLGKIEEDELKKGLIAIGVLLAELLIFSKISKMDKMGVKQGLGMIAFAFGLYVLSEVVSKFSEMDQGKLTKALIVIGSLLTMIGIFMQATQNGKSVLELGVALIAIGAAMLIFASAIEKIGNMPLDVLAKGLGTIAISLAAITLALRFMPSNSLEKSAGILLIAVAMKILAGALKSMGSMSWEEIVRSLVALGGALLILTIVMKELSNDIKGAATLVIVAFAITVLATALKILGSMPIAAVCIALGALAGLFLVLGLAGYILGPVVYVIVALAGAIALLGVAVLAIGAGLLFFSMGLASLAVSGAVGAAALVLIVQSLLSLIPYALKMLAEGLIQFALVIADSGTAILAAITTVLIALCDAIILTAPKAAEAFMAVLTTILAVLVTAVPMLVDAGLKLLLGFLKGVAKNIKGIVEAGADIVINFLKGIAEKLPDIIEAAFEVVISFINGLADAIRNNSDAIFAACENLVTAIVDAIKKLFYKFTDVGTDMIQGIIDGVTGMAKQAKEAAVGVAKSLLQGIKDFLGIKSPATEGIDVGMNLDKGLAKGLSKYSSLVSTEAVGVGDTALSSLGKAMSQVSDVINNDLDMAPTIRPIVDLTDVANGANQVNSLLGGGRSLNIDTIKADAIAKMEKTSAEMQTSKEIRAALTDMEGMFKEAFEKIDEPRSTINFNGTYSFADQEDIDYFMNQAALLVQRRKG